MSCRLEHTAVSDSPSQSTSPAGLRTPLVLCLVLAAVTVAVYWQVHAHDFVNYDDPIYVRDNGHIQEGFSIQSVRWAFTTGHASNWHPITWLSHLLDCTLFGVHPGAHHLVNVALHVVNTILLLVVLGRLTGRYGPSSWVAALFALHPLHVESVAWISERKDVLSTFFWLLTIWAYAGYARRSGVGRYLLTFILLVLGLMSKPMLVTLPLFLLLLDFWPLGRISVGARATVDNIQISSADPTRHIVSFGWLLIEKLPLLMAVTASSVITYLVQHAGEAMMASQHLSLPDRLANAVVAYSWYIAKMIWPAGLALYYPHKSLYGGEGWSWWLVLSSGCVLIAITVFVLRAATSRRYLLVGWLWYLISLVPVIGLVQVGTQSVADRYTYVPLVGLFMIVAFGLADLLQKWRYSAITYSTVAYIVSVACAVLTWIQIGYWQDDRAVFGRSVEVTPTNYPFRLNLGSALLEHGQIDEATEHFRAAMAIDPTQADGYNNLAWILVTHPDPAHRNADEGLKLAQTAAHLATGVVTERTRYERQQAASALDTLAAAYAETGQFDEAVRTAGRALDFLRGLPTPLVDQIEQRLDLYKQNQPYRDIRFN